MGSFLENLIPPDVMAKFGEIVDSAKALNANQEKIFTLLQVMCDHIEQLQKSIEHLESLTLENPPCPTLPASKTLKN